MCSAAIVFSLTWAADPEVCVRHSAVEGEVPDEEGVGRDAEHAAGHPVLCVLQVAQVGPPPTAAPLRRQHSRRRQVCTKKRVKFYVLAITGTVS
jgi:hypothetical protein